MEDSSEVFFVLEYFLSDSENSITYIRYNIVDLLSKFGGLLSTILVSSALIAKQINKQFFLAKVIESLFFIHVKEYEEEVQKADDIKKKKGKTNKARKSLADSILINTEDENCHTLKFRWRDKLTYFKNLMHSK